MATHLQIPRIARSLGAFVALTLVLVGLATWSTLRWQHTAHSAQLDLGRARDAAVTAAGEVGVSLSSLDYRHPAAPAEEWKSLTTGALYDALSSGSSKYQKLIKAGRLTTTATVTGAAVSSLDRTAQHATVLVGLDVTVEPAKGDATVEHERVLVTLRSVNGVWKADAMKPVGS